MGPLQRHCEKCNRLLQLYDRHDMCLYCLGYTHAVDAMETPGRCPHCTAFTDSQRRSRMKRSCKAFRIMLDGHARGREDEAQRQEEARERADPNYYSLSRFVGAPTPAEAAQAIAAGRAQEAWSEVLRRGVRQYAPGEEVPLPDAPDVAILADDDVPMGQDPGDEDDSESESGDDDGMSVDSSHTSSDDDETGSRGSSLLEDEQEGEVLPPAAVAALVAAPVAAAAPVLAAPVVAAAPVLPVAPAALAVAPAAPAVAPVAPAVAPVAPAQPLPYDDTEIVEVFKKASARCGLTWPSTVVPVTVPESRYDYYRKATQGDKEKPQTKFELPLDGAFLHALKASWDKPHAASSVLTGTMKVFDCATQREEGLEALPPMDKSFAGWLTGSNPNSYSKDPEFSSQADKDDSKTAGTAYKCAATVARALNATTLLQGSASHVLLTAGDEPTPEDMAELRRLHLELLRLTQAQSEMVGRTMAKIVVLERARWLELSPKVGRTPLDQRVSTSTLFASMLEELRSRDGQTKTDTEIIGACLPAAGARPKQHQPYKPTYERTKDRDRSLRTGRSGFKAPGPRERAPSTEASASRSRPPRIRKKGDGRRRPSSSPADGSNKGARRGSSAGGKSK